MSYITNNNVETVQYLHTHDLISATVFLTSCQYVVVDLIVATINILISSSDGKCLRNQSKIITAWSV